MKNLRWLVLMLLPTMYFTANAQDSLAITSAQFYALQDTQTVGSSYSLQIGIKNLGGAALNDSTLSFAMLLNDSSIATNISGQGLYYTAQSLHILPGNTDTLTVSFNFTNLPFTNIGGPSVVVIWPITQSGILATDSLIDTFYVVSPSGIPNLNPDQFKVYISGQQLQIHCNVENMLQRVRIYDNKGALVLQQKVSADASIPMDSYLGGSYYAELILTDNSRQLVKLFYSGTK